MIAGIVIASLLVILGVLAYVLIGPFERPEQRFVTLQEPIKMIGISTRTTMKSVYNDVPKLGKEYLALKERNVIPNKKDPWAFVAVSKDFREDGSWEYLMGDVVTTLDSIPPGLLSFEIPVNTYAVFPIRPKSRYAWGIEIGRTKKYIFNEWLPNSGYEADPSVLGDFEYHDERSTSKQPEIDLYVSVRAKKD
jgi:AraC family transcriptional regulator